MALEIPVYVCINQHCDEKNSQSPAVRKGVSQISAIGRDPAPVIANGHHHPERCGDSAGDERYYLDRYTDTNYLES